MKYKDIIDLDARAFAVYATESDSWVVPGGFYEILVGASSRDIRLKGRVSIKGQTIRKQPRQIPDWLLNPSGKATQADFESLLWREIDQSRCVVKANIHRNALSTI
jgi:hypothetical protein